MVAPRSDIGGGNKQAVLLRLAGFFFIDGMRQLAEEIVVCIKHFFIVDHYGSNTVL